MDSMDSGRSQIEQAGADVLALFSRNVRMRGPRLSPNLSRKWAMLMRRAAAK